MWTIFCQLQTELFLEFASFLMMEKGNTILTINFNCEYVKKKEPSKHGSMF